MYNTTENMYQEISPECPFCAPMNIFLSLSTPTMAKTSTNDVMHAQTQIKPAWDTQHKVVLLLYKQMNTGECLNNREKVREKSVFCHLNWDIATQKQCLLGALSKTHILNHAKHVALMSKSRRSILNNRVWLKTASLQLLYTWQLLSCIASQYTPHQ